MDSKLELKYRRVLDILPDVAECLQDKAVLVGGTALALFHLQHRISIDLDFAVTKEDTQIKEKLKGCLTKKGYLTARAAYQNQFVVHFQDSSIKIEVFIPEKKIEEIEDFSVSNARLQVASIEEIFKLKKLSYADRLEARDLFDIMHILIHKKKNLDVISKLIEKHGKPVNMDSMKAIAAKEVDYLRFKEVIENASKTSDRP